MNVANLIDAPIADSLAQWWKTPWARQAYINAADKATGSIPVQPDMDGSGIVTCGGGDKYFPSLWVLLTRLRDVGCKLPIEVWHLGEAEIDPWMREALQRFAPLTLRDGQATEHRLLAGWELKIRAIRDSAFRHVLYLDADNAPTRDPTYLLSCPQYKEHGCILWPDYPHWSLTKEQYEVFGVEPPDTIDPPTRNDGDVFGQRIDPDLGLDLPIESGQVVVDRLKCWLPLYLADWYCQHSEYYFRHVHGDKECLHMAFRLTNTPYAIPMWWPHWDTTTQLQYDFEGNILFAHRTAKTDKWSFKGNKKAAAGLIPYEIQCFAAVGALRELWPLPRRCWVNDDHKRGSSLLGKTFTYHRLGYDIRYMRFGKSGKITTGVAENERLWSRWRDDTLAIVGDKGPTCLLKSCEGGWKGKWLVNEKCDVELLEVET